MMINNMLDENNKFDGGIVNTWIKDLESDNSRTHKEKVIERALIAARLGSAHAQAFLFNAYLAYNPYYVYHVKQIPVTKGIVNAPNPWVKFWSLCESLRTRSVTGHSAKNAINEMSRLFDSEQWNMGCRRVLIKDFRCGVSVKTLNKVLKDTEWQIPVFTCQLAKNHEDHPSKMVGMKRLEHKFDGVRVLAIVGGGGVTLMSREGKPFDNFPHIADAIMDVYHECTLKMREKGNHSDTVFDCSPCFGDVKKSKFGIRFVLDGEVVSGSFQKLMRQTRRKKDADASDSVFQIFDIIPLDDFEEGYCSISQEKRALFLENAKHKINHTGCLKVSEGIVVDLDTNEGNEQMLEFYQKAIDLGLEGIMIKDMDAPYECKKGTNWLKWKPTITVDLEIVGYKEGTGKNEGKLGAFICEGEDDGRKINVSVGNGYDDDDLSTLWAERDNLLGRIVEIKADAVTQNQDGTYSLRFPRFKRFRGFESGEKL